MSQENIYEQRWDFRRKDGDFDSSSEDKGSNSNLKNSNPIEEEETTQNQELNLPKAAAKQRRTASVKKTLEKKPKKNNNRGSPRTAETKQKGSKKIGNIKNNLSSALHGLEMHVNVLVKGLNDSREGLMKWMEEEVKKLVSDASPSKTSRKLKSKPEVHNKKENQEAKEAQNPTKTPTVLALADNTKGRNSAMVASTQSTNNAAFIASNYFNLANLNPRPLAENYLVKASTNNLMIQNSHRDPMSMQQQSGGYYQGISQQSDRDLSASMGTYPGFARNPGFNAHNLGLSGSEVLAQENNFPSLRMRSFLSGSNGLRYDDMNNLQFKY